MHVLEVQSDLTLLNKLRNFVGQTIMAIEFSDYLFVNYSNNLYDALAFEMAFEPILTAWAGNKGIN